MQSINFITIFSIAFLGSFSHCIFMCGGFVTLLNLNKKSGFFLNLTYQISRIFAYIVLGSIFGYFGGVLVVSSDIRAGLFFVVGLILVFIGFALLTRGSLLKFIENDRVSRAITTKIFQLKSNKKFINVAILGFLNGFLPCGLVYYFLAMSILSQSALNGMIIMAVFGFTTLFAMLFLGYILKFLKDNFRDFMFKISIFIIIANGFYLSYLGFMANG